MAEAFGLSNTEVVRFDSTALAMQRSYNCHKQCNMNCAQSGENAKI